MNIKLLAIDIAKNVFQLHGVDARGKVELKKTLKREELLGFIANFPQCTIVMEACSGANDWARRFQKQGHEVKLISPQYVKPFVKRNKNDANDAEAIAEAASRPDMCFVPIKTLEQQDIQSLHRVRERLVCQRTQLCNQMRGLLLEYGIPINKGILKLRKNIPGILEDAENGITDACRELCNELYEELVELEKRIIFCNKKINSIFNSNEICQRISKIEGVGVLTATAILTVLSDPKLFKNGRHFAAFLGLVPRQFSSGGKDKLMGISKRGNTYLRTLLIHGGRSVILRVDKKTDMRSTWIKELKSRRGVNRTSVAVANKNARIIWSLIANEQHYKKAA